MTIATTTNIATHTGNGATTEFPFAFIVLDEAHLSIQRKIIATGVVDKIYLPGEYTVVGIGDAAGGTITILGAPLAATYQLIIQRIVPYTQPLDIVNQGGFFPGAIEEQLDNIVMQVQQLANVGPLDDAGALQLSLAQSSGAALIGYAPRPDITDEEASSVQAKLREAPVSLLDFMTASERQAVIDGAFGIDVTAKAQNALDALVAGEIAAVKAPEGGYKLSAALTTPAGTHFGWRFFGDSNGKTVFRQDTNNIPIFQFTVNVMHSMTFEHLNLKHLNDQTAFNAAAAFQLLDGGGTRSFYRSFLRNLRFDNSFSAIDSYPALWWGYEVTGFWAEIKGRVARMVGSPVAGQPDNIFQGYVKGGGNTVYLFEGAGATCNYHIECNGTGPLQLKEISGGLARIEHWAAEKCIAADNAGDITMFDMDNSRLLVPGHLHIGRFQNGLNNTVYLVDCLGAGGVTDIDYAIVSFENAALVSGIANQAAGSRFIIFRNGGSADMGGRSVLHHEFIDFSAGGVATPSCELFHNTVSGSPEFANVADWCDPRRFVRMGDANYTMSFKGPGVIIAGVPLTAARKIIMPYDGTGGGMNMWSGWGPEVWKLASATGAFDITVRNYNDSVTLLTIPSTAASGRYRLRWDRTKLDGTGGTGGWTCVYLGPIGSETGWTAGTGTANKGAFAAYAGQNVSAGYVEAEAQATDDAAKNASQRIKAIEDALRSRGMIN